MPLLCHDRRWHSPAELAELSNAVASHLFSHLNREQALTASLFANLSRRLHARD